MPEDPARIAGIVAILLLSLAWHEAAHAWVADRLGDPTARALGRVTLNPIKHLDLWLSVIIPTLAWYYTGLIFGGGKPVPIDLRNFRNPPRDFLFVALAGPFSNLALALGFTLVFGVCAATGLFEPTRTAFSSDPGRVVASVASMTRDPQSLLEYVAKMGVLLNVLLAIFNLVPIPPLDGSRLIGWLLPRPLQVGWYRLDRLGFLIVILFFFVLDGFQYVKVGLAYTVSYYMRLGDWVGGLGGAA